MLLVATRGPHNQRGGGPGWDPGLRTQRLFMQLNILKASCVPGLVLSGKTQAFLEEAARAAPALTHFSPSVRDCQAPAPQEAEAQARPCRPLARSLSPRFCPRSTAYGRLRSDDSTGLGASACPIEFSKSPPWRLSPSSPAWYLPSHTCT